MAGLLNSLKVLLPKRSNPKGTATTATYNPTAKDNTLAFPAYREHLTDIFSSRASLDSRALLKNLFVTDPDMSASVHAFLTVANTQPRMIVRDANDQIDRPGQLILNQLLMAMTTRVDYTKGFRIVPSLESLTEAMRYMLLLRGAIGGELIVTKEFVPSDIRMVDMGSIEFYEKEPGLFTPQQRSINGAIISLDIPTFFATWFRRDPTGIYSNSPFVSAINTIAARQQVVNDLYRIMQITGFPRMSVKVIEEVVLRNAPPSVKLSEETQTAYIRSKMAEITSALASIRPDQTFVHLDSVEPGMLNEKNPGNAMNVDSVIEVLNAQNQAGLRTMATIIGRGTSGVNTATVEARVFSMSAEAINVPIGDFLSQAFTMAIRLQGSQSYVDVKFLPVELRSATELETQLLIRSQRLKEDLSLGIISDDEYTLAMYNRITLDSQPPLSGTGFHDTAGQAAGVDVTSVTPNSDPLNRSATPKGGTKGARNKSMGKAAVKPNAK